MEHPNPLLENRKLSNYANQGYFYRINYEIGHNPKWSYKILQKLIPNVSIII